MHIVSALFVDTFEMKQAPGPATHIDMMGVFFSLAAPNPVPVTIEPHLMALIYCQADDPGSGIFEVIFKDGFDDNAEQLARNVSPFTVEPGKFTYRLVRGALELTKYGLIFAHCRVDQQPWHKVPLTLLPPVS